MSDHYSRDLEGAAYMARMHDSGYDDGRPTRAEAEADEMVATDETCDECGGTIYEGQPVVRDADYVAHWGH